MSSTSSIVRDTIRIERTYPVSPDQVFRIWESVEARARWMKPFPEMDLFYDRSEFRVGGTDIYRCGHEGHFNWAAEVQYLDIVTGRRLIYSERMAEEGVPQCASIVSVELFAKGKETLQVVTIDVLALDGSTLLDGYAGSWNAVLDNISAEFEQVA